MKEALAELCLFFLDWFLTLCMMLLALELTFELLWSVKDCTVFPPLELYFAFLSLIGGSF